MSAVWFFIGYVLGCVMSMGAIYLGHRIAERNALQQKTGGAS
ncbi:hypothetical protein ACVC7V_17365 [Hydrogenophaga sp. A37]|nr:hypothetical protein [Hydrogenophaga sp. A37]